MLNDYLPNKLLKEGMIKRDYFLKNVEKDDTWLAGPLIVPFRGASASTVKLGGLAAAADINETRTVRGEITTQPEIWGSLVFNARDIMEHGVINEQNLIKLLPDEIDDMLNLVKTAFSMSITSGEVLATATTDGTAGGLITVDRVERFEVGMPVQLFDNNTAAAKYWVKAIDVNTNVLTLSATVDIAAVANISAYTVAQGAVLYLDGAETAGNRFSSLKGALLSAANGGTSTLYGVSKLLWPYLQAINVSGALINATNLLDKLFDALTDVRNKGKGMADRAVMSYKHLGTIMKLIELSKGAYKSASSDSATIYGWTEIDIVGVKGQLKVVGIQEMDNDVIFILDMAALKVYSNGFFKKHKNPDGNEFYTIRNVTGYQYIVDTCFFGDLVVERPSRCGIVHSIPNY
jgi:hypothetical protein